MRDPRTRHRKYASRHTAGRAIQRLCQRGQLTTAVGVGMHRPGPGRTGDRESFAIAAASELSGSGSQTNAKKRVTRVLSLRRENESHDNDSQHSSSRRRTGSHACGACRKPWPLRVPSRTIKPNRTAIWIPACMRFNPCWMRQGSGTLSDRKPSVLKFASNDIEKRVRTEVEVIVHRFPRFDEPCSGGTALHPCDGRSTMVFASLRERTVGARSRWLNRVAGRG